MLRTKRLVRAMTDSAVAMTMVFIAAVMVILASCERKPVMAHAQFVTFSATGWHATMPLKFNPVYDDSTARYDIALAVRHDNSYRYRNLSLVIDVIAADSTISRQYVDMVLADQYGNWTGGGFGALYQDKVDLLHGMAPDGARAVVVWQTMQGCDTLTGLVNVGLVTSPLSKNND